MVAQHACDVISCPAVLSCPVEAVANDGTDGAGPNPFAVSDCAELHRADAMPDWP